MPTGPLDLNAALAPGLPGAVDVDSAITAAIAYWNSLVTRTDDAVDFYDDTSAQAAAAIALLTAEQARIRNPSV